MKNKFFYIFVVALLIVPFVCACSSPEDDGPDLKPRLVVMTDIAPSDIEPDDMESAIHLMTYADQFEIEAIMTTVGWNCDPYPQEWSQYLTQVVAAYEQDVKNLMKRSNQTEFLSLTDENGQQTIGYWPSATYIRSRCMPGSQKAGIGVIGADNDSEGSDFLIRLADEDDPRPIWVAAWGSANTLAQAIWKVQQTRSPEQLKAFLQKFRVYTITDQDMVYGMRMDRAYSSHQWMRKEFKEDLKFIWDEGTWQQQCELGKQHWNRHQQYIQKLGALGQIYPNYKWGVEGDTPSFLYILPNGLHDPEDPTQVSWAGYHQFGLCADSLTEAWTSWEEPLRSQTIEVKNHFYKAEINDFCARMQWVSEGQGNVNPYVRINGRHSLKPYRFKVQKGDRLQLDASESTDTDDQRLSFVWRQEIKNDQPSIPLKFISSSAEVSISFANYQPGTEVHYILEVTDNGNFPLSSYAHIIVEVTD